MREFISKYADRIHGVLSCFDRMLFRGYLPIMSGWQMAQFFNNSNIRYRELKPFLLEHLREAISTVLPDSKNIGGGKPGSKQG